MSTSPEEIIVNVLGEETILVQSTTGEITSNVAYHHVQGISSDTWEVVHNLGFYPNVTTMDSGGSIVEGELEHLSAYRLQITFSAPISGNAYLS